MVNAAGSNPYLANLFAQLGMPSQLIMAQRGFQASVQVTKDAQDTYQSALQIGRA
mgnify:CR=1 FL=1